MATKVKPIKFVVELVPDMPFIPSFNQISEMMKNIRLALEHEMDTGGLMPEDAEVFTDHINIRCLTHSSKS